ncbi:hypothetical protein GCM10010472_03180 [Pseudonocardia halophobica]|uniref:DUF4231 domain-containing protein n=1 Tax=Pseudonocardia halophobica TaxID=29401 RepID=A0A9W6KZR3_9PSEU|nr:hypothetical protein GCM10017577_17980 [Pseudonocardia halophobica]
MLGLILYAAWWVEWIPRPVLWAVYIPAIPLAVSFCVASYFLKSHPGFPTGGSIWQDREYKLEGDIELDLARLRDDRKHLIASFDTPFKVRRVAYKEDAFADIDRLRADGGRYRNVSNFLQGILIIGSLAATGIAGIIGEYPFLRWVTLGLTFAVGISSGFTGYFKYKERSFYLQQTADAIENEWEAVEVGVGRYKQFGDNEELALAEFVEEIHRLKSEQKKRQQNLEQPPDERAVAE